MAWIEVDVADVTYYVDHVLETMVEILRTLGDELANEKPAIAGANSPFQIVTHCLGVMEFWGGERIAGREVHRDRPAEFAASGRIDDLIETVAGQRERFFADLSSLESRAAPKNPGSAAGADDPSAKSQSGVVLHVLEELFQHLGHLEITRDVLAAVAGQQL
ncbi:MAG: DUF664 domain-containing protein [Acidimicrobiales bacterium]